MNDLDLNGLGIVELNQDALVEVEGGIWVIVGIIVIRLAVSIAAGQQNCY